jgi:uncharacterized protein (DUF1800 family)
MGDAAHLLRRAGFGVTPGLLGELMALPSRNAAVDRMLDVSRAPSAAIEPIPDLPGLEHDSAHALMVQWWLERMRTSPVPLVEKMTLFWHGHFVSGRDKVEDHSLLFRQNKLFRGNALGSYYDLVQSVAVDPAMLIYLDNFENRASGVQENFGREVLELFTIGVRNVTEPDVVAMARAWTGHGLAYNDNRHYQFHPEDHDDGKFSLFGSAPRRWNGPDALHEVLRGAKAEVAAQHITAKLVSFFAYPTTVDDPFVRQLADGFRANDLDLTWLVRSLLRSDAFWGPKSRLALVRSPVEWMVASLQATDVPAAVTQPHLFMEALGQVLFQPPNVSGWRQNGYWLNTSVAWGRARWALLLRQTVAQGRIIPQDEKRAPKYVVREAASRFGLVELSPTTRAALEWWVERQQAAGMGSTIASDLVLLMLLTPDFQMA